jgi:hypothetical protein
LLIWHTVVQLAVSAILRASPCILACGHDACSQLRVCRAAALRARCRSALHILFAFCVWLLHHTR